MEDDYNFEDFEYEPEEIPSTKEEKNIPNKNNTVIAENTNSKIKNNYEDKKTHINTIKNKTAKQNDDNYGYFEDAANDDIQEVEEVKLDNLYSGRQPINNYNKNELKSSNNSNKKETAKDNNHHVEINNQNVYNNKDSSKENFIINKGQINHEYHSDKSNFKPNNMEDLNSISAIMPQNSRIQTHNNNNETSIYHAKLADIKGNNAHVVSRMQQAEKSYVDLKSELDKLLQHSFNQDQDFTQAPEARTKVIDQVSKENLELIKYLDKMSHIVNVIIDNSRVPVKNPNFSRKPIYNKNQQLANHTNNNNNNNKLLDVYKKEFSKLETRMKQISDPNYEEYLDETLTELNNQITFYEQENRKLKNSQKQSEVVFERQYKNNVVSNAELKKINMDYENVKKLNEMVLEKVQKNRSQISDNENRINELNEWHTKLDTIAREMYGIKDYENIKEEEISEKKIQNKKQNLRKKLDVLEKVMSTNKKKFETEITRNEKTVVNLEKNKIELMKVLKEKTVVAYKTQEKVKGIYNKCDESTLLSPEIFGDNLNNNDIVMLNKIINGNNLNTEIVTEVDNVIKDRNSAVEDNEMNIIRKSSNKSSLLINKEENLVKKQTEITKKEILKELEKKSSNDSFVEKKVDYNSAVSNNSDVFVTNATSNMNKNTSNNNQNSRLFKPNIKFNSNNNDNSNKINSSINTNQETVKQTQNIIPDNNESVTIRNVQVMMDKNIIIKKEKEKKVVPNVTNDNDIPEINNFEDKQNTSSLLNNSRRKNNNNNSINISTIIAKDKEKEKENINNNKSLFLDNNTSNLNNSYINPIHKEDPVKEKSNVPLFLQDFHKKNEENNTSILNNSNINNNVSNIIGNSRRVKERDNSTKAVANLVTPSDKKIDTFAIEDKKQGSLFEDAFKEDNKNQKNLINNKIKLSDSIEQINSNGFESIVVDKKKKEDFDNLFKDDPVEVKQTDNPINNINTNNLLFSNKNSIGSTGARNRDSLLNNFNGNNNNNNNNNVINKKSQVKEKPKDMFDELEEIVL